ncbi:MAG: hypothetical protein WC712_07715 [Candidatus Brocadiia bacterium]
MEDSKVPAVDRMEWYSAVILPISCALVLPLAVALLRATGWGSIPVVLVLCTPSIIVVGAFSGLAVSAKSRVLFIAPVLFAAFPFLVFLWFELAYRAGGWEQHDTGDWVLLLLGCLVALLIAAVLFTAFALIRRYYRHESRKQSIFRGLLLPVLCIGGLPAILWAGLFLAMRLGDGSILFLILTAIGCMLLVFATLFVATCPNRSETDASAGIRGFFSHASSDAKAVARGIAGNSAAILFFLGFAFGTSLWIQTFVQRVAYAHWQFAPVAASIGVLLFLLVRRQDLSRKMIASILAGIMATWCELLPISGIVSKVLGPRSITNWIEDPWGDPGMQVISAPSLSGLLACLVAPLIVVCVFALIKDRAPGRL